MPEVENTADVIVIGGGVAGASTAMQLALRGTSVIVLERSMLGSGSTGRAAGLLGQLRSTRAATKMLVDGLEVVKDLQRRTETEIFVQTGSMRIASTPQRAAEIRSHVALGKEIGLDVEHIDKQTIAQMCPYMKVDDLVDACYCPTDGHLQPAELLAAYVKVAREAGVTFHLNTPVEKILTSGGPASGDTASGDTASGNTVTGVRAGGRDYFAPAVVNATGPWSYLVADTAAAHLPTAALGHYYLTTAPSDDVPVDRHSPAVRDRENRIYARPEAGGLIVGTYEAEPTEYDMENLPEDFDMSQMTARRDELNVAVLLDAASRRYPFIGQRTPLAITTGIMTFTPDGGPCCGASAEIEGLYHAAGFCGHGIVQSPTIGVIMAELILDGQTQYNIAGIEADRFADNPELKDRATIKHRCQETYSNYYGKVMTTDAS